MKRRELPAAALATLSAMTLSLLIYLGSRRFKDFDAALIGYAVASVFAFAAAVYRYTLWIMRPPTWRYFKAGWTTFLSVGNFRRYAGLIPRAWWRDIFGQSFIRRRSRRRWFAHMSIFWGVVLSGLITFPLAFGWIRFSFIPPRTYQAWFFGLPVFRFPIEAGVGFAIFHALDFTAVLLIVGVVLAMHRRIIDLGLATTQRFGFDLVPLVLLFAIAVTGLALTASSLWWHGRFYSFISLTHQVTVVGWLISLPFGKFFHIVQRPASIGVSLYQTVDQGREHGVVDNDREEATGRCRRCARLLPSPGFVADLKATLTDLNQDYDLEGDRGWLQEYCPDCKRTLRAQAYYQAVGKRFV